jgi:hypothetical protein
MIIQIELQCGRILDAQQYDTDKHAVKSHCDGRMSSMGHSECCVAVPGEVLNNREALSLRVAAYTASMRQ